MNKDFLTIGIISALIGGLIGAGVVTFMINPRLNSIDETINVLNDLSSQIRDIQDKQDSFELNLNDLHNDVNENIDSINVNKGELEDLLIEIEYAENSLNRLIDEVSQKVEDIETQLLEEIGKKDFHLIYSGNLNDFEVEFPRTGPVSASSYFYETPFFEVNGKYIKIDYNIDVHNMDVGFSWTGFYLRI